MQTRMLVQVPTVEGLQLLDPNSVQRIEPNPDPLARVRAWIHYGTGQWIATTWEVAEICSAFGIGVHAAVGEPALADPLTPLSSPASKPSFVEGGST